MPVTRTNILEDQAARDRFIEGVLRLKREIVDEANRISTYDAFVIWHHRVMYTYTPEDQFDRNGAHSGPVFLPWHRFMLMALEQQIQRVLEDPSFGLPYWAWNADGDLPADQQKRSPLWTPEWLGGDGDPADEERVPDGPFAHRPGEPGSWRVRVVPTPDGRLQLVDDGLRRWIARDRDFPNMTLPTTGQARVAVALPDYDEADWLVASEITFRNVCEGWVLDAPALHNRVHVWIGGDMGPSTSPNDPAFYLNHCNVDRMWAAWQAKHPGSPYLPGDNEPESLRGHRLSDELISMYPASTRIRDMLDVAEVYSYASLDDLL